MRRFFGSLYRVVTRSAFLAVALLIGLVLWYLPSLLELNEFRPELIDALQSTFHCRVLLGNVTGQLLPFPGLIVSRVVFVEDAPRPRVLASVNGVRLELSPKTLWKGRLIVNTVRFIRPRFIIHQVQDDTDHMRWAFLALPKIDPSRKTQTIDDIQIRNGIVEYWDHSTQPTTKWVADHFNGTFKTRSQTGAITGRSAKLGKNALLDIHYDGAAPFPLKLHLKDIDLDLIQALVHTPKDSFTGSTEFDAKARFEPDLDVRITMQPIALTHVQNRPLRGQAAVTPGRITALLQVGTTTPMSISLQRISTKKRWDIHLSIAGYDAAVVKEFYHQAWLDRLRGLGTMTGQVHGTSSSDGITWAAEGRHFEFEGTSMRLPEFSAHGDAEQTAIDVRATTAAGGWAEVSWSKPGNKPVAALEVNASSFTVREVLQIFHLQSSTSAIPGASMNAHGYEPWLMTQGSLHGEIDDGTVLVIQDSNIAFAGMHLDLTGQFPLTQSTTTAHVQGDLLNIPVPQVVESFFKPPSPITGNGRIDFSLNFPLSDDWIKGLNGTLTVQVDSGVLKALKAIYRVMSVLNLEGYLRLRLPQIGAQGIVFQNIKGHLKFQNGILSAEDLFLKSTTMNVGVKGTLDIPAKRMHLSLRLEMFHFLEDILRDVPITHWIFKKPNKILLPLLVIVDGPWDNLNIH